MWKYWNTCEYYFNEWLVLDIGCDKAIMKLMEEMFDLKVIVFKYQLKEPKITIVWTNFPNSVVIVKKVKKGVVKIRIFGVFL
jgi:hypothetical protein